jgi:hypothetical protein
MRMSATAREVISQDEGDREHVLACQYADGRREAARDGCIANNMKHRTEKEEAARFLHHYEGFRDGRESDGKSFRKY